MRAYTHRRSSTVACPSSLLHSRKFSRTDTRACLFANFTLGFALRLGGRGKWNLIIVSWSTSRAPICVSCHRVRGRYAIREGLYRPGEQRGRDNNNDDSDDDDDDGDGDVAARGGEQGLSRRHEIIDIVRPPRQCALQ